MGGTILGQVVLGCVGKLDEHKIRASQRVSQQAESLHGSCSDFPRQYCDLGVAGRNKSIPSLSRFWLECFYPSNRKGNLKTKTNKKASLTKRTEAKAQRRLSSLGNRTRSLPHCSETPCKRWYFLERIQMLVMASVMETGGVA